MTINNIKLYRYTGYEDREGGLDHSKIYFLGSIIGGTLKGLCITPSTPYTFYGQYSNNWGPDFELTDHNIDINMTKFKYEKGCLFFKYNNIVQYIDLKHKAICIDDYVHTTYEEFRYIKVINKPIKIKNT